MVMQTPTPRPTPNETRDYIATDSSGVATGTGGADDIFATADGQTLIGGGGDDVFHIGTHTGLTLQGGGGGISAVSTYLSAYVLPTGIDNLAAAGGGSHALSGNLGDNVITGSTGNDTLNGGGGHDLLIGGGGSDTFVVDQLDFNQTWSASPVEIGDFDPAHDVVDLRQYLQIADPAGTDPFADGTLMLESNGSGGSYLVYEQHLNSGATGLIPVVTFDNVAPSSLTAANFITGIAASPSPSPAPAPSPSPSPAPNQSPGGNPTPTPNVPRDYVAPNSSGVAAGTSGADDIYATANGQTLIGNGGGDIFHTGTNTGLTIVEP